MMDSEPKTGSSRKRLWKSFFELYRWRTELWKAGSEEYKNKDLRNEGYAILLEKFREIDPDADVRALKRKLNTFRSNYRRELRKIKDSTKSATAGDDVYVPTLWYYKDLNFLNEQEVKFEEKSIMSTYDETVFLSENEDCKQEMMSETGVDKQVCRSPLDRRDCQSPEVFNESESQDADEHLAATNEEPEIRNKSSWEASAVNDEAEIHSKTWAIEYRKLSSTQRLLAKHKIDEILFQGRLGLLKIDKIN